MIAGAPDPRAAADTQLAPAVAGSRGTGRGRRARRPRAWIAGTATRPASGQARLLAGHRRAWAGRARRAFTPPRLTAAP